MLWCSLGEAEVLEQPTSVVAVTVLGAWFSLKDGSLLQKDQFGMYALYSKNKPKSDSLLASHGNTFFKVSSTASIRIAQCVWSLIFLSKANLPA